MAIQLQNKSDEITKTKDEMHERNTKMESTLQVFPILGVVTDQYYGDNYRALLFNFG